MAALKHDRLARNLARLSKDRGNEWVYEHLEEHLAKGDLKPEDFSLRDLAEELIPDGREVVASWGPKRGGGFTALQEDAQAVTTGHFANITGQVMYSKIMDAYANEEFVFTAVIPTQPTQLSGEKIPGISQLGDNAQVVGEAQNYPRAGVIEDWIETPSTTKRGEIVEVTKEAVFFDRTNVLLARCGAVGNALGINKEKRAIDCIVDENTTAHRYRWRGQAAMATYNDNTGSHTFDNLAASNGLVDWTDIDGAELLFAAMTDPNTGEPIMVMADTIIACPELDASVFRVLNATMIALSVGGFATSGNLSRTDAANPVGASRPFTARYRPLTSRLLPTRMATDTSWFLGSPSRAFAYMENWPITVVQQGAGSEDEFNRDIVFKVKASERGAYATVEPRLMVKSTVA